MEQWGNASKSIETVIHVQSSAIVRIIRNMLDKTVGNRKMRNNLV